MKLGELINGIDVISVNADTDMEIKGVCYDSRKAQDGFLFVAVSGFKTDGHGYIPSAVSKGASVIVCEKTPQIEIPYVLVSDCRMALALISRNYFGSPADGMTVIGVTGTNGKTTSTYLLKHMLETKLGAKVGLVGTNGNMIGESFIHSDRTTPESYELYELFSEMRDAGCTHVVMEVSSHSLVLNRVAGVHFDVGIYTNLTQDHLDFHKDMDDYAAAKSRMFTVCTKGCFNADDEWMPKIRGNADCGCLYYSINKKEGLYADDISLLPTGVSFTAHYEGQTAEVSLGIPGRFSVYNALGVMLAGIALGMSLSDCAEALKTAEGVKGRMETVPTDGDYTIVIDYSHTPDALANALRALRLDSGGHRLVALFGCGGDRDNTKRPVMGKIAAELADFVIVTSDNPRTEDPQSIIDEIMTGIDTDKTDCLVICDRVEAIQRAIDMHEPGDIILLAGKGHEDYQEIGGTKRHLDEREVVAEYIEKRKNK